MTTKRVLVAFDGSPGATAALEDLVQAGLPANVEAIVLSIADVWIATELPELEGKADQRLIDARRNARQRALEILEEAKRVAASGAERLREMFPSWTVEPAALADSPAWGILSEAKNRDVDLIVAGSHGRSLLQKIFLGSVSHKVAAECHCSIRIFRPQQRQDPGTLRILVALDGSSDSQGAMEEVASRNWLPGVEFQIVAVLDRKMRTLMPPYLAEDGTSYIAETLEKSTRLALEKQAETLRQRGFKAEIEVFDGDPKTVLVEHASRWKADAIFMGARGVQHGARLYLGTVASAVLTRAHCTVEIVRPRAPQAR